MEEINDKLLTIYSDIDDLIVESDENIESMQESEDNFIFIFILPTLIRWLSNPAETFLFIFSIVVSTILGGLKVKQFSLYKSEVNRNEQLKELSEHILEVEENTDEHFYESYVLTDYFKDEDYSMKKVKQMNEYLSEFDKTKSNSCFNEVGIEYNYSPISESKSLEIEDKEKDKIENVKEFKVITDTRLVDKYLEQPLFLEDNQKVYESSINNLELRPGVFDNSKKKINKENNGYTHIEISTGKVKVLTIDKRK